MIVKALKELYVSAGKSASDLAGKNSISEVLEVFANAHFGANELPVVTADDNGKMAKVVNGAWDKVAFPAVYKPAGDKEVTDLTDALLNAGNLGNVYNCTTSGTTTNDFVGGSGKTINVGDNVAVVDVGTAEEPSYKFDLLSGMVDTSTLQPKTLATPLTIGGQSQTTVEDALGALAQSGGGGGASDNYSTTETAIGTWIDGKTLYRKVFYNNGDDVGKTIDVSALNIDTFIDACGSAGDSGYTYNLYGAVGSGREVLFNKSAGTISVNNATTATIYWFIVRYTKTTDPTPNA